ncbi:MAG: hypothetical protein WCK39_05575 [Methanomassiliicoccales archaeon]
MLPDHCKDISLREVDFRLTEESIMEAVRGRKAYTRTEFMVLKHGSEVAVIHVTKVSGKELFRAIAEVQILALPEESVYLRDESIDVLNRPAMANLARRYGRTVVVSGMFNHISFHDCVGLLDLDILDVVPPSPSKLAVLAERAFAAGLVELPIVLRARDIDLNELSKDIGGKVMFPCRASGLERTEGAVYLDETPDQIGKVTLVGCDLSRRIFHSIYGRETPSVDMCPHNLVGKPSVPTLIKCCKVKEGYQLEGNLSMVPWGATVKEVAAAINALFA